MTAGPLGGGIAPGQDLGTVDLCWGILGAAAGVSCIKPPATAREKVVKAS